MDITGLAGTHVVSQLDAATAGCATVGPGIDDVGVIRTDGNKATLRAAHGIAVFPGDGALAGPAGDLDGRVVHLGAVHAVGELVVRINLEEACRGLVVEGGPGSATVQRYRGPAVAPADDAAVVARVKPHVMVVAVGEAHLREGVSSIGGLPELDVQAVAGVRVLGIGEDVGVVPGPAVQLGFVGYPLPGVPAIIRTEEASVRVFGFDEGPYPVRPGR